MPPPPPCPPPPPLPPPPPGSLGAKQQPPGGVARPQAFCCLYSIVLEKPPFGILVKIFKMLVFFMWLSLTGAPSPRLALLPLQPRLDSARGLSLSLTPRRVLADRCPHLAHRGHVHRGKCAIAPAHIAGTPSSAPRETLAHAPSPQATDFLRFTSASSPPSASPCPSSISRTLSLSRLTRRRSQHGRSRAAASRKRGIRGSGQRDPRP